MKHKSLHCLLYMALLMTGVCLAAHAQHTNLTETNLRYLYDQHAPLVFDSRVVLHAGEATVFLRVDTRIAGQQAPQLSYEVRNDYKSDEPLAQASLNAQQLIKQEGNVYYYQFSLPVTDASHYIFVYAQTQIDNQATELRYDIALETDNSFPFTDLLLMRQNEDIPLFESYIEASQPFRIVSWYQQLPEVAIYFYSYRFAPNPPPMATRAAEAAQNMSIDSLFTVKLNDSLRFSEQGLYFVQTDTTSLSGISFRITDKYYPKLVSAETLAEPLRYISTSEEVEQIEESEDKKEALDRYWIKVTRSQERAKAVIRTYYRQVNEANRLFTSYKEGWKTGQGMVFVLYGMPDQVLREDEREVWIYNADQDLVDLTFSFVRVKNIYTEKHYNLIPDEDYKKFWFRNIDLWRKGMKTLP